MQNKITYDGNGLYNGLNFGLYGCDDVKNPKSAMKLIKTNFINEFKQDIKQSLDNIGLKYKSMNYYSPIYYNYTDDSLDLNVVINDISKYKKAIQLYSRWINELLSTNQSSDVYIATTILSVDDELLSIESKKDNFKPDILIINFFLNKDIKTFKDFNITEYLTFYN